jgi:transcriptional regulator with XRE-family HTH domain
MMPIKKNPTKSVYQQIGQRVQKEVGQRIEDPHLDIHHAIRDLRIKKGLSGAELCRKAGDIDAKTLTALEKGRIKNPSIKTLSSCARAMGVTISELFRQAELTQQEIYYEGTQKGAFSMDFPKEGLHVTSFTPLTHHFFCGKFILKPKAKLTESLLQHDVPIYLSCLIGRVEMTIENQKKMLEEGENLFFHGVLKHSIYNPLHKDVSLMVVMAPSFLK